MIIKDNNPKAANILVVCRVTGEIFHDIKTFDTKTKEATVYIRYNTSKLEKERLKKFQKENGIPIIKNYSTKRVHIYDKNRKGGRLLPVSSNKKENSDNVVATAVVTIPTAILVNKRTLKPIKEKRKLP